ncbi:MAG: hypothetical protein JWM53_2417 [bacterium]|nr:hypothetical protein [bacterium]
MQTVLLDAYAATQLVPLQLYEAQAVFVGQTAQAVPAEPHAPVLPPPAQLPAEQQPPLHGWFTLHEVVHLPIDVSHAWFAGQSLEVVQPHAPEVRQAVPLGLPAQLWQSEPTAPHTPCEVPG